MKMFPKCRFCFSGSLDKKLVHGKIVLCDSRSQVSGPFDAGAVGALVQGQGFRDIPLSFPLPGSYLALQDGVSVYDYINSTRYQLKMLLTLTRVQRTIYTCLIWILFLFLFLTGLQLQPYLRLMRQKIQYLLLWLLSLQGVQTLLHLKFSRYLYQFFCTELNLSLSSILDKLLYSPIPPHIYSPRQSPKGAWSLFFLCVRIKRQCLEIYNNSHTLLYQLSQIPLTKRYIVKFFNLQVRVNKTQSNIRQRLTRTIDM